MFNTCYHCPHIAASSSLPDPPSSRIWYERLSLLERKLEALEERKKQLDVTPQEKVVG
jgi:hypothetical protein